MDALFDLGIPWRCWAALLLTFEMEEFQQIDWGMLLHSDSNLVFQALEETTMGET